MIGDARGTRHPRLLAVTRIWPTADQPSAGIFVANRFRGVPNVRVVVAHGGKAHWLLRLLAFAWQVLTARGRFDGVEAHVLYPAGFVGLLGARLRRIPLVAYAHGTDVRAVSRRGPLYRFCVRLVARRADAVVTNSIANAHHVRALGREPEIIPPGVDLDRFRPEPLPAQRRVLYVGGASENKGYAVAAQLADTLLGPGLDEVSPGEIPAILARHWVLLMPSLAEAFGLAAVEAIAAGRWVVASDVGGLREIVIDGVNGTLVSDGDFARALANVPPYEPAALPPTVARYSLRAWQAAMADLWDRILSSR